MHYARLLRRPQHLRRFCQLQKRVALQIADVVLSTAREIEANPADEQLLPEQSASLRSQNLCALTVKERIKNLLAWAREPECAVLRECWSSREWLGVSAKRERERVQQK